ncbi:MAG: hypothetical protein LBB41_06690 [Prevotellaceae bacterium]|jgi:hypothetical protein|nr:hypothetical protein [Prevotellaceae bacterium]
MQVTEKELNEANAEREAFFLQKKIAALKKESLKCPQADEAYFRTLRDIWTCEQQLKHLLYF